MDWKDEEKRKRKLLDSKKGANKLEHPAEETRVSMKRHKILNTRCFGQKNAAVEQGSAIGC